MERAPKGNFPNGLGGPKYNVEYTLVILALIIVDLTKQLDMEKKKNEKNKENLNKLEEEHKELKKVKDQTFLYSNY